MTETNFVGLLKPTITNLSPYSPIALTPYRKAFTMAEILLSLTIIGVVAAITLPSLMANINERTWNTQRKALYARLSQAIAMMPNLNGYGEYEGTNTDGSVTATKDTAAEAFLTDGLSKVLKINNICDAAHLADCGVVSSYTNLIGTVKTWPKNLSELNPMFTGSYITGSSSVYSNPQNYIDTNAAAFETLSGETLVVYYNPYCVDDLGETKNYFSQTKMCANFIYDLNGNRGPNTVGKDIGFITALHPTATNVVAPMPLNANANNGATVLQTMASEACTTQDPDSRVPNRFELHSIFYNRELLGIAPNSGAYWSSSLVSAGEDAKAWAQVLHAGLAYPYVRSTGNAFLRCVKR